MQHLILRIFIAHSLTIAYASAQNKNITILYTNDIESTYDPIDAFWNDSIEQIGGIAYLADLINKEREKAKSSFLFDAGDIFTGALSAATEGKLPFDLYSAMEYDAMALGNHEFEYGWEKLSMVMQRASFPVLNCNIFYANTDINFCQSYTIVEKDNIRIGLIGAMGIEAFNNTINPAHSEGLEVRDPKPIVQQLIDEIHHDVDLIVLLTHQNRSAPMQTDKEVDPEVQRGVDEDYALAGKLVNCDIIIGGHSDNGLWKPIIHPKTGTLICQTFGQGKYLGYLNLDIIQDTIALKEGKLIPVAVDQLKAVPRVNRLIKIARNEFPALTEVIAKVEASAIRRYYRESSLGNLFADIIREYSGADIGIINPGSLRADLNKGNITVEDIVNIYPFIDKCHITEIDGQDLKKMLEYGCSLSYGLAQLSGVSLSYDSKAPIGARIQDIKVDGQAIDNSKIYKIASSAFLANGGDGFDILRNGNTTFKSDTKMVDYFIDFMRNKETISIPDLGRQLDLSRK